MVTWYYNAVYRLKPSGTVIFEYRSTSISSFSDSFVFIAIFLTMDAYRGKG